MLLLRVLKMTPESFAGNPIINVCIQECLQYFEGVDRSRIERELRSDARARDKSKFLHTFRELIFGSYLMRRGCRVRPYQEYNGSMPDMVGVRRTRRLARVNRRHELPPA